MSKQEYFPPGFQPSYIEHAAELVRLDAIGAQIANMPAAKREDLVNSALAWITLALEDLVEMPQTSGTQTVMRALDHARRALKETRKAEG